MSKLLSIIIPCYNCSENINELFDELTLVMYQDIEVIFVNDGSTDDTSRILEKRISNSRDENNCYLLINQKNKGAASARTLGLEKSRGEYIFFVDSDDSIPLGSIEYIISQCKIGFNMLYFNSVIKYNADGKFSFVEKISIKKNTTISSSNFLLQTLNNNQWTSAVWTFVFNRKLVTSSCAVFTNRNAHEDHLFTMKILETAEFVRTSSKTLYIQNHTKGSLTTSKKDVNYIVSRIEAFNEVYYGGFNILQGEIKYLYFRWSFISILHLILSNKKISFKVLTSKTFVYFIFKNFLFVNKVIFSILYKKLKS